MSHLSNGPTNFKSLVEQGPLANLFGRQFIDSYKFQEIVDIKYKLI